MKVLIVLGEIFWSGLKYLGKMLLVVAAFSYIFSGFGIIFAVALLEPILEGGPAFYPALITECLIIFSWLFFLHIEVKRRLRIKELKH